MTYCTPYLLQLGLTKSRISLVWIAGPLSGLIMQPIVGVIADKSTSRFGRRRPFMVGGAIVVSACLLVLGYTKEIVQSFVSDADTVRSPYLPVSAPCFGTMHRDAASTPQR
jgi:solute carrier family 45, member 1/2/4